MPEAMKATIPVFVFLLKDNSQVYLQRRYQTGYHDGEYEPPAGKIDVGEFPKTAACREVLEEAGVVVEPMDLEFFHSYLNISNNRPWLGLMFRTRQWKGEPAIQEPAKCDDAKFFDLTKLPNVTPQVREGLARLLTSTFLEISTYDDIDQDTIIRK